MANVSIKISQLKQLTGSSITYDDYLPIVDSGSARTYRITLGDIITKAQGGIANLLNSTDQQIMFNHGGIVYGDNTLAYNYLSKSLANGYNVTASGLYSHAEGYYTIASGTYSHAEGYQTYAFGSASHAEGYQTYAFGTASNASGIGTYAYGNYQTVIGKYNVTSSKNTSSLFIVGAGTSNGNTKDIFLVDTGSVTVNGNINFSGNLISASSIYIPSTASYAGTSSYALNVANNSAWQYSGLNFYYSYPGSNVGIQTSNPQYTLDVNGTIRAVNGISSSNISASQFSASNAYISNNATIYNYLSVGSMPSNTNAFVYPVLDVNGQMHINSAVAGADWGIIFCSGSYDKGDLWIGTADNGNESIYLFGRADDYGKVFTRMALDPHPITASATQVTIQGTLNVIPDIYGNIGGNISCSSITASNGVLNNLTINGTLNVNVISSSIEYVTGSITMYTGSISASVITASNILITGNETDKGTIFASNISASTVTASNINLSGYINGQSLSSNFIGSNAGNNATNANSCNFIGSNAGFNATYPYSCNFIGSGTGQNAYSASYSNFIGQSAGYNAYIVSASNFIGFQAGINATTASYSNFIGWSVGNQAYNASQSNFIGYAAGYSSLNAANSNFIGFNAGSQLNSGAFSNIMGYQAGYGGGGTPKIGNNNIIIGTNITLPVNTNDSINLGGIIFATGSYNVTTGNPTSSPVTTGKVGIGVYPPQNTLDVAGNISASVITASLYGANIYTSNISASSITASIITSSALIAPISSSYIGTNAKFTGSIFYSGSRLWVYTGTANNYGAGTGWSTASLSV